MRPIPAQRLAEFMAFVIERSELASDEWLLQPSVVAGQVTCAVVWMTRLIGAPAGKEARSGIRGVEQIEGRPFGTCFESAAVAMDVLETADRGLDSIIELILARAKHELHAPRRGWAFSVMNINIVDVLPKE